MKRTIEQAAEECRAAWAAHPEATHGWCIHHQIEMEELKEPIENRIEYILTYKPEYERTIRLDNLRPVLTLSAIEAKQAYDKATAPAQQAYDKAIASEWQAYDKAIASEWQAYDKAIASAWQAYDKATASAWQAYEKAVAPAWQAYNKAIAPAHKKDVPNHTWNGRSIFVEE